MPKAQSAIEYLTTYAWAIIIIAIAVGVLYSLGVFDTSSLAAKAKAGACQVYRPYGPGTTQIIDTQGVCNNGLPASVAYFAGGGSYVSIPNSNYLNLTSKLTITAWIYANNTAGTQYALAKMPSAATSGYAFPITTDGWNHVDFLNPSSGQYVDAPYGGANSWHFVAATFNGIYMTIYVDGVSQNSVIETSNMMLTSNPLTIGQGQGNWFYGRISNVQIYNSSFNSNQIRLLYTEGIGAEPTLLQYLVGWWPLNGDTTDYSGNGNNGVANDIFFSGSWTKGYSIP